MYDVVSKDSPSIVEPIKLDAETILLFYFDLDELAELTEGELRLLKVALAEGLPEDETGEGYDNAGQEYTARVRGLLTSPRTQEHVEEVNTTDV